jgi:hypothetical protein
MGKDHQKALCHQDAHPSPLTNHGSAHTPPPPPPPQHTDYGAGDLAQANTLYLDAHWGIGASVRELLHGVDW